MRGREDVLGVDQSPPAEYKHWRTPLWLVLGERHLPRDLTLFCVDAVDDARGPAAQVVPDQRRNAANLRETYDIYRPLYNIHTI